MSQYYLIVVVVGRTSRRMVFLPFYSTVALVLAISIIASRVV